MNLLNDSDKIILTYNRTEPEQLRFLIDSGKEGRMRSTSSCKTLKSRRGRRATPIHLARLPFPSTTNYD